MKILPKFMWVQSKHHFTAQFCNKTSTQQKKTSQNLFELETDHAERVRATKTIQRQMSVGKPLGNYANGRSESILWFHWTKVFVINCQLCTRGARSAAGRGVSLARRPRCRLISLTRRPPATPTPHRHRCTVNTPTRHQTGPRATHAQFHKTTNNFPSNEEIAAAIVKYARKSGTIASKQKQNLISEHLIGYRCRSGQKHDMQRDRLLHKLNNWISESMLNCAINHRPPMLKECRNNTADVRSAAYGKTTKRPFLTQIWSHEAHKLLPIY